jgi:hypothetical protein
MDLFERRLHCGRRCVKVTHCLSAPGFSTAREKILLRSAKRLSFCAYEHCGVTRNLQREVASGLHKHIQVRERNLMREFGAKLLTRYAFSWFNRRQFVQFESEWSRRRSSLSIDDKEFFLTWI